MKRITYELGENNQPFMSCPYHVEGQTGKILIGTEACRNCSFYSGAALIDAEETIERAIMCRLDEVVNNIEQLINKQ